MGDTAQASLPDGTEGYFEHAGPIETDIRLLFVGKESSWKLYGHGLSTITIRGMNPGNMLAERLEAFHIEFQDGTKYSFMFPKLELDGATSANRVARVKGQFKLVDITNDLTAVVDYVDPESKGMLGGWFGGDSKVDTQ